MILVYIFFSKNHWNLWNCTKLFEIIYCGGGATLALAALVYYKKIIWDLYGFHREFIDFGVLLGSLLPPPRKPPKMFPSLKNFLRWFKANLGLSFQLFNEHLPDQTTLNENGWFGTFSILNNYAALIFFVGCYSLTTEH